MKSGEKIGILALTATLLRLTLLTLTLLTLTLLAIAGSRAADYRPDEFLSLDLSRAVLSPKLLGASSGFVPLPAEAANSSKVENAEVATEPENGPAVSRAESAPRISIANVHHGRSQDRRLANRPNHLARHRGNPLDAQAMDSRDRDRRINVWPCRTGGICGWRQ